MMPRALSRRLGWLLVACSLLLLVSLLALLVNLELAVRVFLPGWLLVERVFTAPVFARLSPLGADLSVVSTAVPVLLFAFPLWRGWQRRQELRRDPDARSEVVDPYPDHFPFFCVMLGLFGTLYGMMVGLSASGVAELQTAAPSAESIRVALDRLLSGTATALLSSIVGMIGAFLAAQPFPALYRWCSGASDEPVEGDLVDVISQVTAELKALAQAGAEARQNWGGDAMTQILARLDHAQVSAAASADALARMTTILESLAQGQERIAASLTDTLGAVRQATAQTATGVEGLVAREPAHREALAAMALSGQAAADQIRQLVADAAAQHQAALAEWKAVRAASDRQADEASRDRTAFRRALASYAGEADER